MKNTDKIQYKITFYELLQNLLWLLIFINWFFILLQFLPAMFQCVAILYRLIFGHYALLDASVLSLIHDILFFDTEPFVFIKLPFSISPLVSIVFSFFGVWNFCIKKISSYDDAIKALEEIMYRPEREKEIKLKLEREKEDAKNKSADFLWRMQEEREAHYNENPEWRAIGMCQ